MNYEIYTDGSCRGNPGPGGWGVLIKNMDTGGEEILRGGTPKSTNNIMELTAVIRALGEFAGNSEDPPNLTIYSDSKYVVKGATEWLPGWIKSNFKGKKNVELWKKFLKESDGINIDFKWVKAHNGHPENELVDSIAFEEASKYRKY
jgi:ribonuclease HI